MSSLQHVLIMAGGTGGHVFPGLAVADYLRRQGVKVSWMGTTQGLEARLVPEAGIDLHEIKVTGLRGKGLKTLLSAPLKVCSAIMQARKVIREVKPDVVLGMGGFASGPGGVACWLSGKPLVIHEQNAKAGLTNKVLSLFAKYVLSGFPEAFPASKKVLIVGNPVRASIEAMPSPQAHVKSGEAPFHLLVLGGSLGAEALNKLLPATIKQLGTGERPMVWHQAGQKQVEQVRNDYESKGLQANVTAFIQDMAEAYQWADLVVCRAGALTVAELCAAGRGAVLIPFPYAVDDHQTSNADFMVKAGAGMCVQQAGLNEASLAEILRELALPAKRQRMGQAAYDLRKVQVSEQIFAILSKVATKQEIKN